MTFAEILALLDDAPLSLIAKLPDLFKIAQKWPRSAKPTIAEYVAFVKAARPALCAFTDEELAFLEKAASRF